MNDHYRIDVKIMIDLKNTKYYKGDQIKKIVALSLNKLYEKSDNQ